MSATDLARILRDKLLTQAAVSAEVKTHSAGEIGAVWTRARASRLSADINAAVTTIPLSDVVDFAEEGGTILIGDEQITYPVMTKDGAGAVTAGLDEPGLRLLGVTRGANSTSAAAHTADDEVSAYPAITDTFADIWMGTSDDELLEAIPVAASMASKLADGLRERGSGEKVLLQAIDAATGGHNMAVVAFADPQGFSYQAPAIVNSGGAEIVGVNGIAADEISPGSLLSFGADASELVSFGNRRRNSGFAQVRSDSSGAIAAGAWFPAYYYREAGSAATCCLGHGSFDGLWPSTDYHLLFTSPAASGVPAVVGRVRTSAKEDGSATFGDPLASEDIGKWIVFSFRAQTDHYSGRDSAELTAEIWLTEKMNSGGAETDTLLASATYKSDLADEEIETINWWYDGQQVAPIKVLAVQVPDSISFAGRRQYIKIKWTLMKTWHHPAGLRTHVAIDDVMVEVKSAPERSFYRRSCEPIQPAELGIGSPLAAPVDADHQKLLSFDNASNGLAWIDALRTASRLRIETGWGYIVGNGGQTIAGVRSFASAFAAAPIVLVCAVGAKTVVSGAPTSIADFNVATMDFGTVEPISATDFTARLTGLTSTAMSTSYNFGFSWIAIGA